MNASAPTPPQTPPPQTSARTIALVGLMGVGKTSVGRRLARALNLPFFDADEEIEQAAGRQVSDIFAELGEPEFRAGEHRVIARLLRGPAHVLATGGGAFIHPETRRLLKEASLTIWLKCDVEILARRVARRDTRPLLRDKDPIPVLQALADARYPIYAEADLTIETGESSHQAAVEAILGAMAAFRHSAGSAR